MLWARYPRNTKAHEIFEDLNIGAITSTSWAGYVYPDGDYSKPDFSKLEQRLTTIPDGYPLHIHTIIAKGPHGLWQKQEPHLEEMCFRILDEYADKYHRWTIATELLIKRGMRIVRLYEEIAKRYPHLELWIGEYGLNSNAVARGIANWIPELQAAANLKGIVLVDYLDLRPQPYSNQIIKSIDRLIPLTPKLVQQYNPETVPDWIRLLTDQLDSVGSDLAARLKLASLEKLNHNMERIAKTGVRLALETSVFVGTEPEPKLIAREAIAYQLLLDICNVHGADFWHWNLFDADFSAPWLGTKEDSCGWFDKDHQLKDWAESLLEAPNPRPG